MTVKVDVKALLESGVHFGHKTSHWNPKMAPYIHSKRQGIYIIDLFKTVEGLEAALPFISKVISSGKKVLFVGTRKYTSDMVKQIATDLNQPYVTERWMGGMLTNVATVGQQLRKLRDLEKRMASGELEKRYSKLEVQRYQEEIDSLNKKYSGIKDLTGKPGAMFVVDAVGDVNAIKEAKVLGIPVVAIVDTNADPTLVDYVIPANDDAIKGVELILSYVKQAAVNSAVSIKADKEAEKVAEEK
jgi:small subunit ribosomal protein S2